MGAEWSKDQILNLIEQYKLQEWLWNGMPEDYKNQTNI
jgi:hypothetical protein